jgi:hypothetical protein
VFKTLAGAQKRAAFETAHSKTYVYQVIRCLDGKPNFAPYNPTYGYTWQLQRILRKKVDSAAQR